MCELRAEWGRGECFDRIALTVDEECVVRAGVHIRGSALRSPRVSREAQTS